MLNVCFFVFFQKDKTFFFFYFSWFSGAGFSQNRRPPLKVIHLNSDSLHPRLDVPFSSLQNEDRGLVHNVRTLRFTPFSSDSVPNATVVQEAAESA